MAYVLKYQSEFYNHFGRLVQVQIAEDDYVGAVTDLRTSEVTLEVNYQDHNNPIIGTGAKVVIVNTGEFNSLDDLLTSREKNFLCTIIYNGTTVFKGFSICDLNEQEFLPRAKITVQFTDYLRRLDGNYLTCLHNAVASTSYAEIIWEALDSIDLHAPLYVNSTLFESTMDQGTGDTFIEQTYLEDAVFYSDSANYDNTYEVLNKALLPAGAYLYSFGDRWVIERQEDVTRTGDWVYFANSVTGGTSTASLAQSYNKQDGDYQYVDTSQKIAYSSGINMLILKLNEKKLDTLTFNDYDVNMPTVSDDSPDPGSLTPRTWYIHENAINLERKYGFRGMETCMRWQFPPNPSDRHANATSGMYYCFDVQFNVNPDTPTELNVNYTMSIDAANWMILESVTMRFVLRLDGGPYSGYFIGELNLADGSTMPAVIGEGARHSYTWNTVQVLNTITTTKEKVYNVNVSIDFSSNFIDNEDMRVYPSLWDMLGRPDKQRFLLYILPIEGKIIGGSSRDYYSTALINYLGDVSISITQPDKPNKITYTANENFTRTEEIGLDLYDLPDVGYSNGLMVASTSDSTELVKTQLWTSENNPVAIPIADIFAKNRYRNNYRTIHTLKSTILYDGHLKPLSIFTDDNLGSASEPITLILLNYNWDLVNGTYDIEAEEYTDEEIIIAEPGEESSGGGGSEGSTSLTAPTFSTVYQVSPGEHLYVQWGTVTGATGYRLQRMPNWYSYPEGGGYWAMYWSTVYSGDNDYFVDDIQETGTPDNSMSVYYRVCAYNGNVESSYSAEEEVTWNA